MSTGYEASEAIAWLLANTPEGWCWQFGYHPFHGSCQGRGPGMRRITLTLLLPEEPNPAGSGWAGNAPRFHEEMTVGKTGASYLVLAERAVRRAQAPKVYPAPPPCPSCGASSGNVCQRPDCAAMEWHRQNAPCPKCGAAPGVVCKMPSCGALRAHQAAGSAAGAG